MRRNLKNERKGEKVWPYSRSMDFWRQTKQSINTDTAKACLNLRHGTFIKIWIIGDVRNVTNWEMRQKAICFKREKETVKTSVIKRGSLKRVGNFSYATLHPICAASSRPQTMLMARQVHSVQNTVPTYSKLHTHIHSSRQPGHTLVYINIINYVCVFVQSLLLVRLFYP